MAPVKKETATTTKATATTAKQLSLQQQSQQ